MKQLFANKLIRHVLLTKSKYRVKFLNCIRHVALKFDEFRPYIINKKITIHLCTKLKMFCWRSIRLCIKLKMFCWRSILLCIKLKMFCWRSIHLCIKLKMFCWRSIRLCTKLKMFCWRSTPLNGVCGNNNVGYIQ